ncbi:hypothetical protein ACWDSL_51470 [Streptomyces sp. NPDC000941]
MATFEITAPARGFNGDVAGVQFSQGRAVVDDSAEDFTAALGYFRRKGYTVVAMDDEPEQEHAGGSDEQFDPAKHSVKEVLAYLDTADPDEAERVIAAEQAGEARKTIL